jgi:hypothetical protein
MFRFSYMVNMLSALSQVPNSDVNADTVAISAPYFPSGADKNIGFPWTNKLAPGRGSTSSQLVWQASGWADGENNQYPWNKTTVSSYEALDQLIKYFADPAIYPNMQHIVVSGHSLGGQMVQRYTMVGNSLGLSIPISYYVGNPDSFAWFTTDRPISTASCPTFDDWRNGLSGYSENVTYGTDLVAAGRDAVYARYTSRTVAYGRGTLDLGDASSTCGPYTTGANRNERFFNFIKAFPPTCHTGAMCDTVDYVNVGHDAGAMFAAPAGLARLFLDNFNGTGKQAYDFGYPRLQAGDDPRPDPSQATTTPKPVQTYAGNMSYAGCYTDSSSTALTFSAYSNGANTIELCTSTCVNAGYLVAGMEYGTQCYCGRALAYNSGATVDSGCTVACPGIDSPPVVEITG